MKITRNDQFGLTQLSPTANRSGRNLYENGAQIATDCLNDKYLPHLLTEKFEQIIADVNASQPFYIQFASPLPKAGSESRGGTRFNRQFTMPEYDRRPAVSALDDKFRSRKQQLGMPVPINVFQVFSSFVSILETISR